MRMCSRCKQEPARSIHTPHCKSCRKTQSLAYDQMPENRARKARYQRAWSLEKKYGISQEDYDTLVLAQSDQCALCSRAYPGGKGHWHVDHDHETGKVRGLLCYACNTGLGSYEKFTRVFGHDRLTAYAERGHV